MSPEGFHDLRHVPGYKYEYFDGRADISVQQSASPTVASPPDRLLSRVGQDATPDGFTVGPASEASVEALNELWGQAFLRTPDYYGYSVQAIQEDARKTLRTLYDGSSPALHPASAAVWRDGTLVGGLLITTEKTRPCIEALFLRRHERRRGLASAILRRAAERLQTEGRDVLCSGFLLANGGSASWHASVGFVELPDWLTQNHRYQCIQYNARRGLVRDLFSARRRAAALGEQVASMREERSEDPEAHAPFRWLKTDGQRIDEALNRQLSEERDAPPPYGSPAIA